MKTNNVLLSLAATIVLSSCASAPKQTSQPQTQTPVPNSQEGERIKVDIEGLKRSLGLDRSRMDLGYKEKRFNTCNAGFGYPKDNCKDQVFISINFRLQCRDSQGTTSEIVTSAQMDPIANKKVKWQLGSFQSFTNTDDEGYAQVNGVFSPRSAPKTQRLKLTVGTQFVYMRAGEITRIVTPSNFCSGN